MKIVFLFSAFFCLSLSVFSQTTTVDITEGRFFITGHYNGEELNNATIKTNVFTATSLIGGQYSPWYDICITDIFGCSFGSTFTVPKYSRIDVGGCVGDCHQFIGGAFTINGITYQNVFYHGYFDFSRESFFIPKMTRRKGTVVFKKPFTMSGQLRVCQVIDFNAPCPADKILFDGALKGQGTLTVTMTVKNAVGPRPYPVPYLSQQSFEYRFEP
ncbi:MAG TPA: hypothetical protein VNB22_14585 [Pyrinomonadaceae bacterium]|jgi:hypothetical protein|nr:hypothetical protein [Pyrinomonadaceae bacterium]